MKNLNKIAIVAVLALAACQGWSKRDTALELSYIVPTALDEGQTQWITAHCQEGNALVGRCGDGPVPQEVYFPLTVVVHAAISAAIPQGWWRTTWQALTLGVEAKTVQRNAAEGVPF